MASAVAQVGRTGLAIRAVGVPTAEVAITDAIVARSHKLLAPGRGLKTYVVEQARATAGRPDIILAVANPRSIGWYTCCEMRFKSRAECEVVGMMLTHRTATTPAAVAARLGVSEPYVSTMMRDMQQRGLTLNVAHRVLKIIKNSLLVEAKVSDWRRAVWQAHRFFGNIDSVAIAMPQRTINRVDRGYLQRIGVGLLSVADERVEWCLRPARIQTDAASRLWVTELLARSLTDLPGSEVP